MGHLTPPVLLLMLTRPFCQAADITDKCSFSLKKQILICDFAGTDYSNPEYILSADTHVLIVKHSSHLHLTQNTHLNKKYQEITSYQLIGNKKLDVEGGTFEKMAGLRYLKIEENSWKIIRNGTFAGLNALEILNIVNNSVEVLEPGAFAGLNGLSTLELTNNKISVLPSNIFDNLHSLTSLLLQNNDIEVIESDAFVGLRELNLLDLSHNKIRILQANWFNIPNLEHLLLGHNRITQINGDIRLPNLKFLYLQRNKLDALEDTVFEYSRELNEIDLAGNNLKDLSVKPFENLPHLVHLNIKDNSGLNIDDLKSLSNTHIT